VKYITDHAQGWRNAKHAAQWASTLSTLGEITAKILSGEPDFEYVLVDGTIVSVHQKASGAKGGLSIKPLAARKAA
jgi:hypothetical protein